MTEMLITLVAAITGSSLVMIGMWLANKTKR